MATLDQNPTYVVAVETYQDGTIIANPGSSKVIQINGQGIKGDPGIPGPSYTLLPANTTTLGGVKVDGATIVADGNGVISALLSGSNGSIDLSGFQTEAGLSANVLTLTANNTEFVGSVAAANVVSNAQLTANLANYQTTAGLSANVATLAANNALYLGGVAANQYAYANAQVEVDFATIGSNVLPNANLVYNLGSSTKRWHSLYVGDGSVYIGDARLSVENNKLNSSIGLAASSLSIGNVDITINGNGALTTSGGFADVGDANNASYLGGVAANQYAFANQIAGSYTLPVANTTSLGGVKADGVTITIAANGTISTSANVVSNAQLQANLQSYQTTLSLAANVVTLTANNTTFVGSVSAANVVSNAQLQSNLANYQTAAGLAANVATLTSNNALYLAGVAANQYAFANQVAGAYTLPTANTSTLGGVKVDGTTITVAANGTISTGANVVSNAQLQSNLANYQTTAGLSANVAALTSNNTSFVGSVAAANVVSNAQLSANLANYQITAGLSANVLTLTANNTSFVGTVAAANVVSNAQLNANLANYQTTAGLAANVLTLTANNTSFVGTVSAANVVSNTQLQSNLANYAALTGAVFTGNVEVNSLTVTGLIVSGNVSVIGANNISTVDNMIYLNANNTSNTNPDIGVVAGYYSGEYAHTGIFRDHTSGTWKVFEGYHPEPDASVWIDQSNTSFRLANFQANTLYVGNNTVYSTINTTSFTGTANNTLYVGSVAAGDVVSASQLSSNLAGYVTSSSMSNYQTTAGLSANVATLTANNTSFVGTVAAANVVSDVQLSANLANYQTTAGLSANVATLTANNTSFVGSVSAANVVSNAQLSANLASYQTTAGLSANVLTLTANNTSFVGDVAAANVVSNAQLQSNLASYQTTAGLSANVATLTSNNTSFVGTVSAANVVSNAQLIANLASYALKTGTTFTGIVSYNANVVFGSGVTITANGGVGTSGQVLTSSGSGVYWATVSSNGTTTTTTEYSIGKQSLTGNGSNTEFTLTYSTSQDDVFIFVNGAYFHPGEDFTVVSNTTLSFTTAPANGSQIRIRFMRAPAGLSSFIGDLSTGSGEYDMNTQDGPDVDLNA